MSLTDEQNERYRRNIILDEIGIAGQEKLLASKVLIVGLGGLGSPAALYLAAAGVGTIGLLDGDVVDLTNLQRQLLHHTSDLGKRKVESAAATIEDLNPDVAVRIHDTWAKAENLGSIVRQYDFVIDAVDNFAAKFLINDACCAEQVAFCHAGILEFEGQLMTVLPGRTPCYRCVFSEPPSASGSRRGVLGVLPGVIGALEATEAMKYLLGLGGLLTDTLMTYNALTATFRKVPLVRDPSCPACGSIRGTAEPATP